jgi:hypothetical protein
MSKEYDSRLDTVKHINDVRFFMQGVTAELLNRMTNHDKSKLESPEKEYFDEYTPILKELKYGSQEYKDSLAKLRPALDHHYANNSHHPEHYEEGVDGMDLLDLLEMMCDWKAATSRTKDGDIQRSLEINKSRFNISNQLYKVLQNTVDRYLKHKLPE